MQANGKSVFNGKDISGCLGMVLFGRRENSGWGGGRIGRRGGTGMSWKREF